MIQIDGYSFEGRYAELFKNYVKYGQMCLSFLKEEYPDRYAELAGTFFITKSNEEGEFISLSKGEIDKYTERFKEPKLFTQDDVCDAFIFEVSYGSENSDEDLEL